MKLSMPLMAVASVLLLQACATTPAAPPPMAVTTLGDKTCAASADLAGAISLTPVKKPMNYFEVSTLVDTAKPCLTSTDNISSNYVVYALPDHPENHTITVGGVQEAIRTFAPSVSLLDADGKVVRTFTDDRFATIGNMLGVQFIPQAQERFILVQSNPALVGKSVSTFETRINYTQGYAAMPTGYGYSYQTAHGSEGTQNRVFSHEGYVHVTVQAAKGMIGQPDYVKK